MAGLGGTAMFVDQTHERLDGPRDIERCGAQPGALGGFDCAAHVLATDHRGHGEARLRAGD